MPPIIQVENLSKKYIIRHEHPERYVALRDVMARRAKKLFSFPQYLKVPAAKPDYEEFWALKDLNFEINQGDRVGIIGRNGAGKSTLLKILSRITEPSTGRITLNGRVASLLEVGTGFHPELTGRENIFLNGAILGMGRAEIRKKFDEIVDFSGVEKFLDTPVKRYSSGMYVRLAFAVAAHLEPEILVVDEVLAVGDAEFQKKCLGKMEDVSAREGRTVLFVSHNLGSVSQLCNRGVLLENGKIFADSSIEQTIVKYLQIDSTNDLHYENEIQNKEIFISKIVLSDAQLKPSNRFKHNEEILVNISLRNNNLNAKCNLLITFQDYLKRKVFSSEIEITKDNYSLKVDQNMLVRGNYSLNCIIYSPAIMQYDNIQECCNFVIIDGGSEFSHLDTYDYGVVFGKFNWIS